MPTIFRQQVQINGVRFNDPLNIPVGAQAWGLDVCDGWKDTPEPDVRSTPFGIVRDGSTSSDFFSYPARYLTLGGYVVAADELGAEILQDYLLTTVFPRNTAVMLIRYESVSKFVLGKRASKFEVEWTVPNGFRWQVTFQCDDPLKYSPGVQIASGGVSGSVKYGRTYSRVFPMTYTNTGAGDNSSLAITNNGNASSTQFFVSINGPLAAGGWRLRNDSNNGELIFSLGLSSTDLLGINFATQVATVNGYPVAYTLTGDFWKLDPGVNIIRLYADYDPLTSMTVSARSAWE